MATGTRTARSRLTLIFLLLSSATLLTLDARDFEPLQRTEETLAELISPFRSGADRLFEPLGDAWAGITGYDDLKAENQALQEELQKLAGQQILESDAAVRLESLLGQLGLPYVQDIPNVVAEVVTANVGNFDRYSVQINRGSNDGIRNGMPVVTRGGLIGRIDGEPGREYAQVALLTDPEFEVGVLAVGTNDVALASGGGHGAPLRVDRGLEIDTEVTVGQQVVTSGVDRSRYPPGIPIGTVIDIDYDEARLLQVLTVDLSATTDNLSFVTVLLYDPLAQER
ncbi:rod shape-determining protein MreC [Candidatus Poriferisocius sp.]|uniref:rod shape-determining protein MreC n=1 Tax=Candidatus Poriferisocius sp. TaxID=3101276 RepID=UPI003B58F0E0